MTNPYKEVYDLISDRSYQKGDRILLKDWDVKILIEKGE